MAPREPTSAESVLLGFLATAHSSGSAPAPCVEGLRVADLDDGGMGSLRLIPCREVALDPVFGRQFSACSFKDSDGVLVIASLYLDQFDSPFELDLWKVDFGRLNRLPADSSELKLLEE
jgi:hypothetical protein